MTYERFHRIHLDTPQSFVSHFGSESCTISSPPNASFGFKRFKQIAELGHLPKHDEESAKAWVYGKLLVALLTEKIIRHASAVSPWGYRLLSEDTQPMA